MNADLQNLAPREPAPELSSPEITVAAGTAKALGWTQTVALSAAAVSCFHLAYSFSECPLFIVGFLFCLFQLRNVGSKRKAFYIGLAIGLSIYAPQLTFFWTIFKGAAVALWLVLAFWIAAFLLVLHGCSRRMQPLAMVLITPFIWTGFEYFRSELYYLRFSWLNVGYAFSFTKVPFLFGFLGVYGIGFALMLLVSLSAFLKSTRTAALLLLAFIGSGTAFLRVVPTDLARFDEPDSVRISGVQLEFPDDLQILRELDRLVAEHPRTDVVVLSEYAFQEPVPDAVRQWCRTYRKFLVAGGKDPVDANQFRNTAFVVGPDGEIVFKQVKSVPIQFFQDGLAATEQKLWESPWGKLGICICYDLSYRRVVDRLVKQGAQGLIVPTMDVADWGRAQHELHGRVAPFRAAEYGLPIFRLCSSGISQVVNKHGFVEQSAPFPGEGAFMTGTLRLSNARRPLDTWLAPFCVALTGVVILWLVLPSFRRK